MPSNQLQQLEQSGLSGSASLKVLSDQGIEIFSIFPKFEASLIFVDKLKIQWAKENGYVITGTFTYKREKCWFQALFQLSI